MSLEWGPALGALAIAAAVVGGGSVLGACATSSQAAAPPPPAPASLGPELYLENAQRIIMSDHAGSVLTGCAAGDRLFKYGEGLAVIDNDPTCPPKVPR